jgi:hypothetical protein
MELNRRKVKKIVYILAITSLVIIILLGISIYGQITGKIVSEIIRRTFKQ